MSHLTRQPECPERKCYAVRSKTSLPLLVLAVTAFAGCVPSPADKGPEGDASNPVTLGLNWYPEAEHGGYYAADVKGEFKQAGIAVNIIPGGPNVPIMQQVARGDVMFGVTNADQLILARIQQAPLVALMAPIQTSPRCIMVHRQTGITRFDELRDMQIAMSPGAAWAEFLKQQVDFENVEFVPPGSLVRFLDNPGIAQQAYVFSEPYAAATKGVQVHCLMVSDLGFNPYTSVLFCHEKTLEEQPELVGKMVTASIQGWKDYLEDPSDTNARIQQFNPQMSIDILRYGADALKPLCGPPQQIGQMSRQRWSDLITQMEKSGVIETGQVTADDVFTDRFLTQSDSTVEPEEAAKKTAEDSSG